MIAQRFKPEMGKAPRATWTSGAKRAKTIDSLIGLAEMLRYKQYVVDTHFVVAIYVSPRIPVGISLVHPEMLCYYQYIVNSNFAVLVYVPRRKCSVLNLHDVRYR
jgi:hypothetical protein